MTSTIEEYSKTFSSVRNCSARPLKTPESEKKFAREFSREKNKIDKQQFSQIDSIAVNLIRFKNWQ
jgi:hypothetical protein